MDPDRRETGLKYRVTDDKVSVTRIYRILLELENNSGRVQYAGDNIVLAWTRAAIWCHHFKSNTTPK